MVDPKISAIKTASAVAITMVSVCGTPGVAGRVQVKPSPTTPAVITNGDAPVDKVALGMAVSNPSRQLRVAAWYMIKTGLGQYAFTIVSQIIWFKFRHAIHKNIPIFEPYFKPAKTRYFINVYLLLAQADLPL